MRWSWRESNPRPQEHESGLLRPFPSLRLAVAASPGRADLDWDPAAGSFSGVSGLCRAVSGSLPAVHRCFWCRAAAVWPRVPLLVAVPLGQPDYVQAARARASLSASLGCPVWRVWATLVATVDSSGLRRNLAAPSWLVVAGAGLEPHVLRLMRGAYIPSLDSVILAGALVAGQSRWRAQRVRASG